MEEKDSLIQSNSSTNILFEDTPNISQDRGAMSSWLGYLKLITVEPVMFLYMMAFMLTSVVEQAFFIYKACKVDLNYTDEICNNLTGRPEINKKVQPVVSTFHQFNDIASHVIPIFLALFIGAWSDRRGRKLLLLLGLAGKLWYSVWIVINSVQDTWTLNTIIWTASLPSGLTGADLSVFAAAFAYLSDVTISENRTLRITVLDVTYLASMPIGVALGKYLFMYFDRSYTIMFALNSCLLVIAMIYSLVNLEWATNHLQRPLKLCCLNVSNKFADPKDLEKEKEEKRVNCFLDFFDKTHLIESTQAIVKWRPNYGRAHLLIVLFSLAMYTFQRDEKQIMYLYMNLTFEWGVSDFSDFRVFQSGIYVIGTLLCIPLMGKWFKLSDTTMIVIGTVGHSIARIVFVFANQPWLFYLGATFAAVGPVVPSVLRSLSSKLVPVQERGKVFAVLSVADSTIPLFSGVVYSQVYNSTIHLYPGAIFWVTVSTQTLVFVSAMIIRYTNGNRILENSENTVNA